jgi:hypothetical protein
MNWILAGLFLILNVSAQAKTQIGPEFYRISSNLSDLSTGKAVRVEGVGTLIKDRASQGQAWIVTAGHVAKGEGLEVLDEAGNSVEIGKVIYDDANDLSAIQVWTPQYPLGTYQSGLQSGISTSIYHHNKAPLRSFTFNNLIDTQSNRSYQGFVLGESAAGAIGSVNSTVLVVAPHLRMLAPAVSIARFFERPAGKHVNSNFIFRQKFPGGFSGSPVLTGSLDPLSRKLQYRLSGILVASSGNTFEQASTFAGPAALKRLIQIAQSGVAPRQTVAWALLKGKFVRLNKNSLEIFVRTGPVGNSIIVDGKSGATGSLSHKDHVIQNEVVVGKLVEDLQHIGMADEAIETVTVKARRVEVNLSTEGKMRSQLSIYELSLDPQNVRIIIK